MMRWLDNRIPPPVITIVIVIGMWLVAPLTPNPMLDGTWRWGLSIPFSLIGLFIAWRGTREFARAKTTINPVRIDAASSLVTSGVFSYTRNPMYLGMALVLIGVALFLNRPVTLLGPVVFVLFITRFQIMPEERVMAQKFGAAFTAYCGKTRRWL